MNVRKYLIDEMRERMAIRARSYEREGLADSEEERLGLEKDDIERGLKVYDLYMEQLKSRDWYPTIHLEGTDFELRMTQLFTYSRYFELQFESMFIMNYDEGGYYELTENDEIYWANEVIKQLESVFEIEQLVADRYSEET